MCCGKKLLPGWNPYKYGGSSVKRISVESCFVCHHTDTQMLIEWNKESCVFELEGMLVINPSDPFSRDKSPPIATWAKLKLWLEISLSWKYSGFSIVSLLPLVAPLYCLSRLAHRHHCMWVYLSRMPTPTLRKCTLGQRISKLFQMWNSSLLFNLPHLTSNGLE